MDNYFFAAGQRDRKQQELLGGAPNCWRGKKDLHCCRARGSGPSTPPALPAQTPVSALAEGMVARPQHAPVSHPRELHWAASSWQIFKELEELCCIPWREVQCVTATCAQSSRAFAALLQQGLIPHTERTRPVCRLGSKMMQPCLWGSA